MDELNLKEMIKSILNEMVDEVSPVINDDTTKASISTIQSIKPQEVEEGFIPDITEVDIRKQFLVPDPVDKEGYLKMKSYTPARLGLWRAGTRYMTEPSLRFRADHAAAQDAVFSYVNEDLVKELGFVEVSTQCKDKDEYLTRPDLGRKFSDEAINTIKKTVQPNQKIQVIVGDGLSSAAIEANIRDILPSLRQGLKMFGFDFGEVVFIKHCRVPAMDQIGEATGADVVCLLIGERPGLVTSESMSAYIAYKPTIGMPEARRTVVSNIHRQGTPAVEAGAYIAEIIKRMLDNKASGLDLKEK
ncbi:ethanolamine ammonia-lyase subunit EutC [Tissierella pigra]|uniref:Ethanolamine ammonia-lyase small subunit n=1 Tax=Tissierella pigra TaxID=2607614 RepID=A0A6N7XGR3_9FIRM|nr:ethanolamine ammonia-lyase subunit EutC [Tissierella pigra]MBU5426246.1 ethanolamine ammonia-lyase subunit EutC [Tissierella pigra]MSU01231.1 ethanolamine ammonia-lyase subunit EutC [Tissierella pigra]